MTGRAGPLVTTGAWLLGLLWLLPLLYAVWAAIHPATYATRFVPLAPLTAANFVTAWSAAPFPRYLLNTVLLVTGILAAQFVLCTPAAYAFARMRFRGREVAFALVLIQLMVAPEVLLVANTIPGIALPYLGSAFGTTSRCRTLARPSASTVARLGLVDTIPGIALPYLGSAFGIFLLRQTFLQVPQELDDAAQLEGAGLLRRVWRVYVPLARPATYVAYGLVSVSFHWNNFLWPLVVADSVGTRPLTVGLAGVRLHRPGRRLVGDQRRHPDDRGAAAGRLPDLPASIHPELHARLHRPATAGLVSQVINVHAAC